MFLQLQVLWISVLGIIRANSTYVCISGVYSNHRRDAFSDIGKSVIIFIMCVSGRYFEIDIVIFNFTLRLWHTGHMLSLWTACFKHM